MYQVGNLEIPIPKSFKRILGKQKLDARYQTFLSLYEQFKMSEHLGQEETYILLKKLNSHKHLLARLFEVLLYLKDGNQAMSDKLIRAIMEKDFIYHVFESELKNQNREQVSQIFFALLSSIKSKIENTNLFDRLTIYFFQGVDLNFKNKFLSEFDIDLQMSSYRKKYKSYFYGKLLPFVWAPLIFENGSHTEYVKFVESLNYNLEKQPDFLLFFRRSDNIDKNLHSSITKAYDFLHDSQDLYFKNIYFRLRDDYQFNRFLVSTIKVKSGLLTNEKRRFYLSKLKKDLKNLKYYLLQLVTLGDFNSSYYFELARHKYN